MRHADRNFAYFIAASLLVATAVACGSHKATQTADKAYNGFADGGDSNLAISSILDGAPALTDDGASTYMTVSPNSASLLCLTATPTGTMLQACSGDDKQLWILFAGTLVSMADGRYLEMTQQSGGGQATLVPDEGNYDASNIVTWDQGQLTVTLGGHTYSLDAGATPGAGSVPTFAAQQAKAASQAWILGHNGLDAQGTIGTTGTPLALVAAGSTAKEAGFDPRCLAVDAGSPSYDSCDDTDPAQRWTMLGWGGIANAGQCLSWSGTQTSMVSCASTDPQQLWRLNSSGLLAPVGSNLCLVPIIDPDTNTPTNPPALSACVNHTDTTQIMILGQNSN